MYCSWVEDELACGKPANLITNFFVCEDHEDRLLDVCRRHLYGRVSQTLRHVSLEDYPGFCYFVLLADGSLKIGCSITRSTLRKRFQRLSLEYGARCIPLLIMPGGFAAEAVLHEKFKDLRLPGRGERFRYSPEVAEYISASPHKVPPGYSFYCD